MLVVLLKHKDYKLEDGFDFIEAHGPFETTLAASDYILKLQKRCGDHYDYCVTELGHAVS